jgi:hypothetical protein
VTTEQPRARPGAALEAHRVADGLAHGFAQQLRDAGGGGPGGEAARLQHQDALAGEPGRVEQPERDERGLAGAGRGLQHAGAVPGEGVLDSRDDVGDGEVGEGAHGQGGVLGPAWWRAYSTA